MKRQIKQHEDLLSDPMYRPKYEATKKERLNKQLEEEAKREIRDYNSSE